MDSQFRCDLKKYRILAGLTQEDLADRVGVRRRPLYAWRPGGTTRLSSWPLLYPCRRRPY